MNRKLILKFLSILTVIISLFLCLPAGIALYYNDLRTFHAIAMPLAIFFPIALAFSFIIKIEKDSTVTAREGFLLVTLGWITASLYGCLPFYFSGAIPSFTDCYFETISGFSTTGASILKNIECLPKALLFWRSLTHWLGGMGIVVLAVAVLPLLGVSGNKLLNAEAPGPSVDKLTPRIAGTAKILWAVYTGMTLLLVLLLKTGGMSLFDSLTHSFGTLATGGFSTKNASIAHFNSVYIDAVITVFMILAGINFSIHYKLLTLKLRDVLHNSELRLYLGLIAGTGILIAFNLYSHRVYNILHSVRHAFFQTASIMTTTGFVSADFETWPAFSKSLIFLMMCIGGCAGSTGGGIKVLRILILIRLAGTQFKYLLHPRGVFKTKIESTDQYNKVVYACTGFVFLYFCIVLSVALVTASAGYDLVTSISTALATTGNIGPGFGVVGPVENYSSFPDYVKWTLSFAMLAGRLEVYTVLVIFTPSFWRSY